MNTATPSFHQRLRAFFSRFSFILKEKYDFFRHHSREVDHHTLHKSPLSESFRVELDTEKEIVFGYFSSLFAIINHHIHRLIRSLAPHVPVPEVIGGARALIPVKPAFPTPKDVTWHKTPVLALPRPSLPAPEERYLLAHSSSPPAGMPLSSGNEPKDLICDPQKLSSEPIFQKIEGSLATLRRFYFTEMVSIVLIILLLGIFFTTLAASSTRYKQPLLFAGRITGSDHIPLADATYSMKFSIYTSPTGTASCVWRTGSGDVSGTCAGGSSGAISVPVNRGLFYVPLGDTTYNSGTNMPALALDFQNNTYYIGVTVESNEEMTPRTQIGGSSFAYNADLFDGLESSQFLRSDTIATSSVSVSTNQYFAFASSDVSHGVSDATTGLQQANTWLKIRPLDANGVGSGGAFIAGISDASSTPGVRIIGSIGVPNGNPADSIAAVYIGGEKSDGANGREALGANETVFQVDTFGTQLLTLLGSGNFGIGTTAPGSLLDVKGTLRLSGATSGYIGLAPAAAAGSTTYTLPSADGTSGQYLKTNGSATLSWTNATLSNISAATANATLDHASYAQTWAWGALASGNALSLTSTSTSGIANNNSTLLSISRSGANANTNHTAYGISSTVTNTHGTAATNVAGYFSASGGTTNYALIAAAGAVGIGTTAPTFNLGFASSSAQTIGVERSSSAVGSSFTIQAGGAALNGENLAGGTLTLSGGIATGNTGSSIEFQNALSGGTGTADRSPTTVFKLSAGHLVTQGTTPTLSFCRANGSLAGTDTAGKITVGTDGAQGAQCVVTFARPYANPPICFAQDDTLVNMITRSTTTASVLTILADGNAGVFNAGDTISYLCIGRE